MSKIFKKISAKTVVVLCDILLVPVMVFFEWLSDRMLADYSVCPWKVFGGKCVACGGTHFVNALLNFKIGEAFGHNQFFFVLAVFFALSFVLWNLNVLCGLQFAKKFLQKMYTIPMLIVGGASMILFALLRNLPLLF